MWEKNVYYIDGTRYFSQSKIYLSKFKKYDYLKSILQSTDYPAFEEMDMEIYKVLTYQTESLLKFEEKKKNLNETMP